MFNHARISVNNVTPTLVTPAEWDDLGPNTNCTLQIQNLSTDPIYVGAEGLTNTSYGCSVVSGATLTIDDLPPKDKVYVLASASSGYIGILRVVR
jgi:hypothetical protein